MAERSRTAPGWLLPAALLVVGVVALGLAGGGDGGRRAFDPRSHERLGTSAFVALMDELGAPASVTDGLPGDDVDVFVLFVDLLDEGQSIELEEWVRGGGTLVVADAASSFAPPTSASFVDVTSLEGLVGGSPACGLAPLDDIDVMGVEPHDGGSLFAVPSRADSCIGSRREAYVVATPTGEGTVVAVGGRGLFVNEALAEGENAPVVAALVAPQAPGPGPGPRVEVAEPGPPVGSGQEGLVDLISPGVRRFLAQLVIAFVVFAAWRSRRLGTPVAEPQPVAVAGSELVAAVGSLLDRSGSPEHAARLLRADLRRFLGDRLGVPADAEPAVFAAVAAERVGADADRVARALGPTPVTDDDALVALAQTIDTIREEVLSHV